MCVFDHPACSPDQSPTENIVKKSFFFLKEKKSAPLSVEQLEFFIHQLTETQTFSTAYFQLINESKL